MTHAHFVAIGGAGMSAVAWLMHSAGVTVTGSDARSSVYADALRARGIDARIGHDAAQIDGADVLVVSSAVKDSNVEVAAARLAGVPVWHRSEALASVAASQRMIAVAGAHGKTTTSAMAAAALHSAGVDASFAIGATVPGVAGAVAGGYAGEANVIVIEADESDGSFLNYQPSVAIVTNVEPDHLDHYGSREAFEQAFVEFCGAAEHVIACADDEGSWALARELTSQGASVVTYGTSERADAVLRADGLHIDGNCHVLDLTVPGAHNRLNAAAALLAAIYVGADPAAASEGLRAFAGTGRRFELRGEVSGVRVVDDYAHHPTEIRALLNAARETTAGKVRVLFQPHLYSRTRLMAAAFATELAKADDVVVAGIYGAREDPEPGISATTITSLMPTGRAVAVEDLDDAARAIAANAHPGDLILTVGAGNVTTAADVVLAALAGRA